MPLAVVGLGSSLGDRRTALQFGANALARLPGVDVLAVSRIYVSPPLGSEARQPFLNAAVLVALGCTPEELLEACREMEDRRGRRRGRKWMDRTLDLDLLWVEGVLRKESGLQLPHPGLRVRPFALFPLLDLLPGAVAPGGGDSYASLSASMRAPPVVGVLAMPRGAGYSRARNRAWAQGPREQA